MKDKSSTSPRWRAEDLILLAVAVAVVAADQVTKSLVVAHLPLGQSMDLTPWLSPAFQLTHITNTGIVFGLLPGLGDLFVVIAVAVVAMLVLYYRHLPPGQIPIRIALGLQLGGALGNLVDRLARGSVVDFIDLNFWPLEKWAIFNLADASIVSGAVLLGLVMLWESYRYNASEEEQQRDGRATDPLHD